MGRPVETVEMIERRFGYFPRRFCWRGRQFTVLRVERVWCTERSWPRTIRHRLFAVITGEGTFELRHDLLHNLWSVHRAPEQLRYGRPPVTPKRMIVYGRGIALVR